MSSVSLSVFLGLILSASLLKKSRGLPIPTTPLPYPPQRILQQPPFDKDGYVDYADPSKRNLAQQGKFSRSWGPPPPNPYDNSYENNYYGPNSNSVQQDFGYPLTNKGNDYISSQEEDYSYEEEETNYIDPVYSGESTFDSPQINFQTDQVNGVYTNPYQPNNGYPLYVGGNLSVDSEYEVETETEDEICISEEDDIDCDNSVVNEIMLPMPSTTQQPVPSIGKGQQKIQPQQMQPPQMQPQQMQPQQIQPQQIQQQQMITQQMQPQQIQSQQMQPQQMQPQQMLQQSMQSQQMQTQQIIQPILTPQLAKSNLIIPQAITLVSTGVNTNDDQKKNEDFDKKLKPRDTKTVKPKTQKLLPPSPPPTEGIKLIPEEPAKTEPVREKEIFSRTTTITKTTTWYLNNNGEIVMTEEIDGKPKPLKGKYLKTSKTTTSGPVPWYLQAYEDVIFEEENEKSKTILDKMVHLKGMNPTSITSYTTAPNPWSTEVHEEVVFEEFINWKESEADLKSNYLGSHASPLDHIVDYLPRTQYIAEEVINILEKNIEDIFVEEVFAELAELEEEYYDVLPPEFPPYPMPIQPPKPYHYSQYQPHHPPILPQLESEIVTQVYEEEFIPQEHQNYRDNVYINEYNPIPNQLTTQKPPLPTQSSLENNFSPVPASNHHQSSESNLSPQPSFNLNQGSPGQGPLSYGNHQQPNRGEHPGQLSRREHQPGQRQMEMLEPTYVQEESGRQEPVRPHRPETENKHKMNTQEAKRQLYQNRHQYSNRGGRPRDL